MTRPIYPKYVNPVMYFPAAPDPDKPFFVHDQWFSRDELTRRGMDDYCYAAVDLYETRLKEKI